MIYRYPAVFEEDKEDNSLINVTFPDIYGLRTFGKGIDDARDMARKSLRLFLIDDFNRKFYQASPSEKYRDSGYYIEMIEVEV